MKKIQLPVIVSILIAAFTTSLNTSIALSSNTLDASKPLQKIAFGSCAMQFKPQPIWNTIGDQKPDLLLFLGDNIYADFNGKKPFTPTTASLTPDWNLLADQPGFNAENFRKVRQVRDGADQMLHWVAEHSVETFAGADLWQDTLITLTPQDMVLRKRCFTDLEILKQNRSGAGKWLAKSGTKDPYREGPLGVIKEGAYADLLLVEGNPLNDVTAMTDWENNLKLIMKDGKIFKNTL